MQEHLDTSAKHTTHKPKFSAKRKTVVLAAVAIIIAVSIGLAVWWKFANSAAAYIQTDKYQAIFLANNQVYFGKLQKLNDGTYRMNDVYYIKGANAPTTGTTPQAQGSADSNAADQTQKSQLVKLGSELHGPTDEIVFAPQNVLFWENLKADGTVSKSIADYKKSKQQ